MPLDVMKAIEIGKAAGLNLSDCRALAALAEDEESAEKIAAEFAPDDHAEIEKMADRITGRL